VQGLAHLIADDPSLCEGLKDDLLASSTSLVNEIKGQRLLLAAEHDQLQAKLAPTRALHALEAVRHLYRNHPTAAGRRVEVDRAAADALLETDETILQRVLGNMVKNALEAVSAGETVTLGVDVKDGACTFWCHNPGAIPPDARLQIFQRSFTTKGPGRGVGTYGIKLLAERYLHGTVGFSSSPEAGTRFHVTMPLR
jgi:signal transduction histidine kinase